MADSRVESWKQTGDLWLWRFRDNSKNYPGWNLAADETGWSALADLLGRMAASSRSCRREISVTKLTARVLAVPNNPARSADLESPRLLIIEVPRDRLGDNHWRLAADPARLALEVGTAKLGELLAAAQSVQVNGGDFAVGPDDRATRKDASLWFWLVPKL